VTETRPSRPSAAGATGTAEPAPAASPDAEPALLAAANSRPGPRIPVWFMRQAGRSLPEYRKLREGIGMLESCRRPDLVTEITLQPVRRYGVDGAVLFSDIVVPLAAVGVDVEIKAGIGPVIERPFRTWADLDALPELTPSDIGFVTESVRALVAELGEVPVIGFAGAPFTLASYLVEGGPSRDLLRTKALMYGDPQLWRELVARLAQISGTFLSTQVAAGARIVQLFDSWVGALPASSYREFVQPASRAVLDQIAEEHPGTPRIHFGVGTGELLHDIAGTGAEVVGVDFRLPLDEAVGRIGAGHAVQGNLDPALLFAPWPVLEQQVRDVVRYGRSAPGHIFNLGHGVPPGADPDVLARVVELVHSL